MTDSLHCWQALGCILYEMCALKKAFTSSNLGARNMNSLLFPFCSIWHSQGISMVVPSSNKANM